MINLKAKPWPPSCRLPTIYSQTPRSRVEPRAPRLVSRRKRAEETWAGRLTRRGAAGLHSQSPGAAARRRVGGLLPLPLGLSFMNGPGSQHRAACLLLSL